MHINSRALQSSMDTDYGLPIPMHRPLITLDDQYDQPLPFRRRLDKVTELTAENSSPYTLPKKRCLSRLEQLPLEIREQIYGYLAVLLNKSEYYLPFAGQILINCHHVTWFNYDNSMPYEMGLYRANRNLRQELLGLSFRDQTFYFRHPLSTKKLFYNNWNPYHCTRRLTEGFSAPPEMERMRIANSSFEFMRRIRLKVPTWMTYMYVVERPHPLRISMRQATRPTDQMSGTVKFITEHCPLLVSLHIDAGNKLLPKRCKLNSRSLPALTLALMELVKRRPTLEVFGIISSNRKIVVSKSGSWIADSWRWGCKSRDFDLNLASIPMHGREDALKTWFSPLMEEALEYGEIIEFVSMDRIDFQRASTWSP